VGYFFGQAIAPQPIVYDPGTTVIYEGDTIYINGQSAGNATTYREQTIALANPVLEEVPVPTPPPDTAEPISQTTETTRALHWLTTQPNPSQAWTQLCHTLLATNEFLYLR
jgi:hypothetical protein